MGLALNYANFVSEGNHVATERADPPGLPHSLPHSHADPRHALPYVLILSESVLHIKLHARLVLRQQHARYPHRTCCAFEGFSVSTWGIILGGAIYGVLVRLFRTNDADLIPLGIPIPAKRCGFR